MKIQFSISHNISSSKGWGRYAAWSDSAPIVQSSTGNEWVSAPHSAEVAEGAAITVVLQTMERVGKQRRESRADYTYSVIAELGASATVGHWNGFELVIEGARIA